MAAALHPTNGNVALSDSSRFAIRQRRYLGLLDISVLLLSLLVFFVFLLLLNRIVFPEGARLGDLAALSGSGRQATDRRGEISLAGDAVDGFGDFVAKLGEVSREVKIRPADSIAWTNAKIGSPVNNRDAVQTFANSRARIDFTTDNDLRIGQNSLVIFSSSTADPFLQRRDPAVIVVEGQLDGSVNSDFGSFAVALPAGTAVLSADESGNAADFKLSVNPDGSSTIAMYAGRADVDVGNKNYQLEANDALTVADDGRTTGVRQVPDQPSVRSPRRDSVAKFRDMPPRVKFEWGPVAGAQNYRLELAKDRKFEEILVDENLNDTAFTHGNLPAGEYFWRISARNGWIQGPGTETGRLRVVRDAEPPLLELEPIQQTVAGGYELRGKTAPDAKVYVLGEPVKISAAGTFSHLFAAAPGAQAIVVEAIDTVGNVMSNSQIFYSSNNLSGSD
jgi:hypothetical protein